ncbi:right-handed parallel beta-helix repeat-containing protein [Hyalangium minutum]|uniref:Right handed beta helix domain-containing protein n=1 Tax=Hyalangium minutum TaxID=394096 RepID=A0A085WIB8_9BACT|nr:right-handed parallel beta-helix repeat-containing protein [Hyalangium minutum]KFE67344.1 hypothetical protein DB31_8697 [Hyalangium minutum]KFE67431.1 hypothetical protein DB31_8784 [Hyalangium minutum]
MSGQVIIRDLGLDGNSANNTTAETNGMVLLADNAVVENTQILNMRGSGIQLTSTNRAGTPANALSSSFPTLGGRIAKNVISKPGGHGILIKGVDWLVEVLDNQIDGTGLDGIVLDSGSVCVVRGNDLFMIGKNGIVTKAHVFITTVK